MLTFRVRNVGT